MTTPKQPSPAERAEVVPAALAEEYGYRMAKPYLRSMLPSVSRGHMKEWLADAYRAGWNAAIEAAADAIHLYGRTDKYGALDAARAPLLNAEAIVRALRHKEGE